MCGLYDVPSLTANYQMTVLLLQVTTSAKCLSRTYSRLQSRGEEIPVIIVSDWYTASYVNKRRFYSLHLSCTILTGMSTPRLCNLFAVRERHFTEEVTYNRDQGGHIAWTIHSVRCSNPNPNLISMYIMMHGYKSKIRVDPGGSN